MIVRGLRNTTDLRAEYKLAAMKQSLGVATVFLPARPDLAAVSSTAVRALGTPPSPPRSSSGPGG
ncbi:hypothetical protein ACGFIW_15885 [Micromonospora sp. NPDC048935]|uniref:hypothetical protein n=1 Tax=Micromonospora sp. NPDC048935 TaxID=3364262 RepID=UPI00371D29FC